MPKVTNRLCIEYWDIKEYKTPPKVLRRINKNNILISTTKFSEVMMFNSLREAMPIAKLILSFGGFDVKIRYCNPGNEDEFYLS